MSSTAASSNGRQNTSAAAKVVSAVLGRCLASAGALRRLRACPPILVPLAVLLTGTVLLCLNASETGILALFHDGQKTWTSKGDQPWSFLDAYGVIPGLVIGISGIAVALLSHVVAPLKPWHKPGLFLFLALAIGPGLIVNGVLKPHWGRPRPAQLAMFGGTAEYSPAWLPGGEATGRSFPSGHASMGFFLMVPGFLLYRRHRRLAVLVFAAGLAGGVVVGLARIVQGRHFPSDVLWSAACVYFSAFLLYLLFRFDQAAESQTTLHGETDAVFPLPESPAEDDYREAA